MEKKYCIIPTSDIDNIDFTKVIESRDTLRYKLDQTEFIIKYVGNKPDFLNQYTDMNRQAILEIINNPANGWTNQI